VEVALMMRYVRTALLVALMIAVSTSPVTSKPDPSSGEEAGGCIQSGTGQAFFRTCTTSYGTLSAIDSPAGAGDVMTSDGYALCSSGGIHGVEVGFGGGFGFGAPTTSTPTSNVRETTDGRFRVTHTFLRDPLEKEIIITVTLKNLMTTPINSVVYARFFDADMTDSLDFAGFTKASGFIWDQGGFEVGRGLELSARTYTFPTDAFIVRFANFDPVNTGCASGLISPNPGSHDDWTVRVRYFLGNFGPGASKIVKFVYRMM
jgi:hypothetical protein